MDFVWICVLDATPARVRSFLFEHCIDRTHPDFAFILSKEKDFDKSPVKLMTQHVQKLISGLEEIIALPKEEKPKVLITDYSIEYYLLQICKRNKLSNSSKIKLVNWANKTKERLVVSVSKYYINFDMLGIPGWTIRYQYNSNYLEHYIEEFIKTLSDAQYYMLNVPECSKYVLWRHFNKVLEPYCIDVSFS